MELIYLVQGIVNSVLKFILSIWLRYDWSLDVYWTTVRYNMPKCSIDAVFIPFGKTIARLTELEITYYLLLKK